MLIEIEKVLLKEKPDGVCVAFDLRAPTFRHLRYEGYKAERKGMPEELAMQLPYAHECAKAIIQSGVSEVVYLSDKYNGTVSDIASKRMLMAAGIKLTKLSPTKAQLVLNFDVK